MTNTHINVGGHKITTNKSGEVHTVTSFPTGITCGEMKWVVINNICYVSAWSLSSTSTGYKLNIASVPACKINSICVGPGSNGTSHLYVETSKPGQLNCYIGTANSGSSYSLSYPVADDWEESTTSEQSAR